MEISNNINFIKYPYKNNELTKSNIEYKPYDYQIEAYEILSNYFKENKRGILSLPCGCGKTYTSYLISNNFSQIIIISPLREFANQNLNRFIEYGYNEKSLLVDTDGERNLDNIKDFIKKNKRLLISTTYKSIDLIKDCLDLFEKSLFIIDEFHNLSKNNIANETNDINKLLKSNHKILFMSATPRIYDIENDEEEYDINDLFGEIVYKMDFKDAIEKKYITDYRIWLPSIHENNEELNKELNEKLKWNEEIEDDIRNRCKYLYSCILNNSSRKIIIYCKDLNDMNKMMNTMKILNNYYLIEIDIYGINCEASENYRKEILNKFANNNDKIQLLFNIKILNECIDIPSCDSIYISYPTHNKITTIQRINRATRIDKNNSYKIANIYLWCDEYNEILDTLSSIKEYDDLFKDKIKINEINFFNNKTDEDIKIINKDEILLKDYIINIKEYKIYTFEEKIKLIEDYIKENGNLPNKRDNNPIIKSLGIWTTNQKRNYKQNKYLLSNPEFRKKWEYFINEYEELFKTNEKIWDDNLNNLIDYIKENGELPSQNDKNLKIKSLGIWISNQKTNYKNNKDLLSKPEFRKKWEDIKNEYEALFKTNEEIWNDNLNNVIDYIKENCKLPTMYNNNPIIKSLGIWLSHQKKNYKNNKDLLSKPEFRKKWEDIKNEYEALFKTNEEIWNDNLNNVIDYIKENGKLPSRNDNNPIIKSLGIWISHQKTNYKNNKEILSKTEFRKKWEEFINEYLN
jgi:superfamily II DNA or RNA helicase